MKLVILESPYAGDIRRNINYARRCIRHSLLLGESPIASHLLYTQDGVLDDDIPSERSMGISAGLSWLKVAEASVVYTDHGISSGMEYGIIAAQDRGIPVEYRSIISEESRPDTCYMNFFDNFNGSCCVKSKWRIGCEHYKSGICEFNF